MSLGVCLPQNDNRYSTQTGVNKVERVIRRIRKLEGSVCLLVRSPLIL